MNPETDVQLTDSYPNTPSSLLVSVGHAPFYLCCTFSCKRIRRLKSVTFLPTAQATACRVEPLMAG